MLRSLLYYLSFDRLAVIADFHPETRRRFNDQKLQLTEFTIRTVAKFICLQRLKHCISKLQLNK
jgi:hypothetical protein